MKALVFVLMGLFFLSLVSGIEPVTLGFGEEENPSIDTGEDICKIMKGCWENNECFPNGYRTEGKFCGLDKKFSEIYYSNKFNDKWKENYYSERFKISNQSNAGENCNNSFECKSNFCFNNECIDTIKTIDDGVVRINKSDLEELRGIIEEAEISFEESYSEIGYSEESSKEKSRGFFTSLGNLFKRLFDWW